ncbi:PA2169 family four-helix-bundle protein [Flavobacterium azooxidireducens]|uniref:PA2169 family four-helix-bundle protein n=1 Tax=Flavobacterium azooxidireducens TaxID=1871076 RepID=A0ABY4KG77_9FLAO|nr:DUF2383 domain-containing protein [Flavobacterium azooxidireducens]UPQ79802.1 PA2169 family four-helix-bundle protein [Flavobacterium azooxidireducens]
MTETDKTLCEELQMLLISIQENERGFLTAAINTSKSEIKIFFHRKSLESKEFAAELIGELDFLDYPEADDESISAYAHQIWFDFSWFFSTCDDEKILQKIINDEHEIVKKYDAVLTLILRPSTRVLLTLQKECIENDLNHNKIFFFYCK